MWQRRIHIDGWVDVGGDTLCFYEKHAHETKVVNIPAACVERVEHDEQSCLVYVHTKRKFRTDGASLFVFETARKVRFHCVGLLSGRGRTLLLTTSAFIRTLRRLLAQCRSWWRWKRRGTTTRCVRAFYSEYAYNGAGSRESGTRIVSAAESEDDDPGPASRAHESAGTQEQVYANSELEPSTSSQRNVWGGL